MTFSGGSQVLPTAKDATEAFEDVGHSDEARALLPNMLVGEFEKGGVRIALDCLRPSKLTRLCRSSRSRARPNSEDSRPR